MTCQTAIKHPVRVACALLILLASAHWGCVAGELGGGPGTIANSPSESDSNTQASPGTGSQELCNGFDDDGDGKVDEVCGCTPGSTQACFPRAKSLLNGHCRKGTQTCSGADEFGTWGPCEGALLPIPETCGDGIDQDCNGQDLPCAGPSCGDQACNGQESCQTCPQDCGACPKKCETFTFGVTSRPVDIVWVIDQSGSMLSDIAMVKQNMNAFASYISKVNIDYHVIVLARRHSADPYYANFDVCIPPPLGGPNCGDNTRFKQVNKEVDSHDSLNLIESNIKAIESFMRPGSLRQFVEVSDDNSLKMSAPMFQAFLSARKGYSDYVFHSVVGLTAGGCVDDVGTVYKTLSDQTGGMKVHICNANWTTLFNELGKKVADMAKTKYQLSGKPTTGSITVSINGAPAPEGSSWSYDGAGNLVVLHKPFPANGAAIKVCYSTNTSAPN